MKQKMMKTITVGLMGILFMASTNIFYLISGKFSHQNGSELSVVAVSSVRG